jgi:hypothetical protein
VLGATGKLRFRLQAGFDGGETADEPTALVVAPSLASRRTGIRRAGGFGAERIRGTRRGTTSPGSRATTA